MEEKYIGVYIRGYVKYALFVATPLPLGGEPHAPQTARKTRYRLLPLRIGTVAPALRGVFLYCFSVRCHMFLPCHDGQGTRIRPGAGVICHVAIRCRYRGDVILGGPSCRLPTPCNHSGFHAGTRPVVVSFAPEPGLFDNLPPATQRIHREAAAVRCVQDTAHKRKPSHVSSTPRAPQRGTA